MGQKRVELEGVHAILSFSRRGIRGLESCGSPPSQSESTLEVQLEHSTLKHILVLFPVGDSGSVEGLLTKEVVLNRIKV